MCSGVAYIKMELKYKHFKMKVQKHTNARVFLNQDTKAKHMFSTYFYHLSY